MTFIALEGCDGAGKSTLADSIEAELNRRFPGEPVERLHRSQLTRDPLDEYALDVEHYVPGQGRHIIADRWHWGETIYGPLYRGESALTEAGFRWAELFLRARGVTVWHVTAGLETIQNRLRVRGEDYLQTHDVEYVWKGFKKCASKSLLTGGTAETDVKDIEWLTERIVAEAIWSEDRATPVFRPEYIGRHLPNSILVGEKKGDAEPGVTAAPFIARGQSSGTFLLSALPDLWWNSVGIVNALETDVPSLVEDMFEPSVVALGAKASEALDNAGVKHAIVPHPQKIRRFHNAQKAAYGALIKRVSIEGGNELSWPK